jgi:hypothetical protein
MQLVWNCLVNVSFGYLGLIAIMRITQELNALRVPNRRREESVCWTGQETANRLRTQD